ncbi:hypothetical protein EVAR_59184_1 [Eumeta japonica]|uniref:Uncharacterized protein n=1 Tax=Eumeta variegata TaxID=151549 RepID=A0A4C1ZFE7_EUMVA|nr:hypothetical protein EVAR_59184_1 [Eumeta japonica]
MLLGRGIERDRARVNAWHSNACTYTCYRPARALATSSVQYYNARGKEKERYTKVESRREKENSLERILWRSRTFYSSGVAAAAVCRSGGCGARGTFEQEEF